MCNGTPCRSGQAVEAVRAAIVHVIFNIAGVLVWLPFIGLLASLATWISPDGGEVAEVPRQIANANTVFNVINTFLFICFTSWFAWIAKKVYPDRPEKGGIIIEPKYLDEAVVTVPSVALEQVRLEFGRMGNIASTMLTELPKAILNRDKQHIDEIIKLDDKIDILEAAIFSF